MKATRELALWASALALFALVMVRTVRAQERVRKATLSVEQALRFDNLALREENGALKARIAQHERSALIAAVCEEAGITPVKECQIDLKTGRVSRVRTTEPSKPATASGEAK